MDRGRAAAAIAFAAFAAVLALTALAYVSSRPAAAPASANASSVTALGAPPGPPPPLVAQLIDYVNSYRASHNEPQLTYCPWLSAFAELRFHDMLKDYSITHYMFYQDFQEYLGQYYGLVVGEEVLYPLNQTNGTAFALEVEQRDPEHWALLVNSSMRRWGYFVGVGPTYVVRGYCPVTEFAGPGIDIPEVLSEFHCNYTVENSTWLVIELSNWCNYTHLEPYLNQGVYVAGSSQAQLQFQVPWPWSIVTINVSSTEAVEAYVSQGSALGPPALSGSGPVIDLEGNLTEGYYVLVITNPAHRPTYVEVNITIEYPIRPMPP